jgi:glycosyltransferase involved in cell wall biosynthesis
VQFVLVGEPIDAEITADVRSRIDAGGLGDVVRMVGGAREIGPYLGAADLFVLPSMSDAMPIALLEAMTAGLPIVATNVGGVPEAIEDGVSGLLAEPGNARSIARQIVRLLDDTETAREMGRQAQKQVTTAFSLAASASAVARVYDGLVAEQGHPRRALA